MPLSVLGLVVITHASIRGFALTNALTLRSAFLLAITSARPNVWRCVCCIALDMCCLIAERHIPASIQ